MVRSLFATGTLCCLCLSCLTPIRCDTLYKDKTAVAIGFGTIEKDIVHWSDCSGANKKDYKKPPYWVDKADNCELNPKSAYWGTWELNAAKSKFGPGAPKSATAVYEAAGDKVKVTLEGTDSDGKPTHSEWTGKFDGKEYPVTGDLTSDARSYKKINDYTLAFTDKKDGKVTTSGRIAVSLDGKSRTVTASGTDPKGMKYRTTAVYDKQ